MTQTSEAAGRWGSGRRRPASVQRLGASVRLPWFVGLVLLLLIAVAAATVVGRQPAPSGVDPSVLAAQETAAVAAAESVRRSANEAAADLEAVALLLQAAPSAPADPVLQALVTANERWLSVALVDPDSRAAVASAGGTGAVDGLSDRIPAETSLQTTDSRGVPRVFAAALVVRPAGPATTIVGEVGSALLGSAMADAEPGSAWLVDADGRVIASLGEAGPPSDVPGPGGREAAAAATTGTEGSRVVGGSAQRAQVLSWAPVRGEGLAGTLGWGVVVQRNVSDFAAQTATYRVRGLVFGLGLAVVTLLVFWWLHRAVISPVIQLEGETERIAYGDLSRPVPARRLDEVGRTARALEKIRLALIRGRHHGDRPTQED